MKCDRKQQFFFILTFIFLAGMSVYYVKNKEIDVKINNFYKEVQPAKNTRKSGNKLLKERQAKLYESFHENILIKNNTVRLPDVIIAGVKKCGTKSLLTFLLAHPEIAGNRKEFHYYKSQTFVKNLGAFLGVFPNMTINTGKVFLTKTRFQTIKDITAGYAKFVNASNYSPHHWIENIVEPHLKDWIKNVKIILCLCDPVRRLLSDFLHVKAEHPNAKQYNEFKFGPKSKIFPFKDLNFNGFVEKYVKKTSNLEGNDAIKKMIMMGEYKIENFQIFRDRITIIDGGKLVTEPWAELQKIETDLDLENKYFEKNNFVKRPDGFYCIKKEPNITEEIICMPETKGRTAHNKEELSKDNENYLYRYYHDSNLNLVTKFSQKFSWFSKFENVNQYISTMVLPNLTLADVDMAIEIRKNFEIKNIPEKPANWW